MNWVLYALLTVTSILRCCLLFELGRMIYENIIMIRGIDEKIDNTTREIKKVEAEIKKIETKEIRNEKTARLCDVCGKEIRWFESRYRFKSHCVSPFEGEKNECQDMCSDCFFSFQDFVKQKKAV